MTEGAEEKRHLADRRASVPAWRRIYWRLHTQLYAWAHGIRIGRHCCIRPGAIVRRYGGGSVSLGDRCHIHPGAMLLSYGGAITLGARSSVNPYAVLYGQGGLKIGEAVLIAAHCVIIPANHGMIIGAGPMADQAETKVGITIGNDVWLGAGVRVLDGCVIEDGCVVAAGAVARGVLQSGSIYGGVPARRLKLREGLKVEQDKLLHFANEPLR